MAEAAENHGHESDQGHDAPAQDTWHEPVVHDDAAPSHGDLHDHASDMAHGDAHDGAHGDGHGGEVDSYVWAAEIPNAHTLIEAWVTKPELHHGKRPHPSPFIKIGGHDVIPINPLFSILYGLVVIIIVRKAFLSASVRKPGKLQNFFEMLLGGLWNFFRSVLGEGNERYIPYVASLWVFIFVNNICCLVPFLKAPTSSVATTFAFGICTFIWVQYNAIRAGGIGKWIYHLMGEPTDFVTWLMMPLFLFLHVLGELIKPVSLSLRLFGNIFGEDKLLAAFLAMGMAITAALLHDPSPVVGLPLHLPFFFLVTMGSTIQATVFSLLAAVYITLLLPHDHDHEEHEAGEAAVAAH